MAFPLGPRASCRVVWPPAGRPGPQVAACPGMALAFGDCDDGTATIRAFSYEGRPLWQLTRPQWRLGHLSISDAGDRVVVSVLPRGRSSSRIPVETTGAVWILQTADGTLTDELPYSRTHCFALRDAALLGVARQSVTKTYGSTIARASYHHLHPAHELHCVPVGSPGRLLTPRSPCCLLLRSGKRSRPMLQPAPEYAPPRAPGGCRHTAAVAGACMKEE